MCLLEHRALSFRYDGVFVKVSVFVSITFLFELNISDVLYSPFSGAGLYWYRGKNG